MAETITTYSGYALDPLDPDPAYLLIEDIAHALSLICRGNGQVKQFYSVGQHCLACAEEAEARGFSDRVVLACLLHDAGECYLSDVPRPFKAQLPAYREMEARMLSRIYTKFLGSDLTEEEAKQVQSVDDALLTFDLVELLHHESTGEKSKLHIALSHQVRPFAEVEAEYLDRYRQLRAKLSV